MDGDRHFVTLVAYIHRNPQKHGFVPDFRDGPYSSYTAALSGKPTRVQRDCVLDWFDGRAGFKDAHHREVDQAPIKPLIAEDWS